MEEAEYDSVQQCLNFLLNKKRKCPKLGAYYRSNPKKACFDRIAKSRILALVATGDVWRPPA